MTEVPGGEGRQRRVGALGQMGYGWGRGSLYLQLNLVPQGSQDNAGCSLNKYFLKAGTLFT